MSLVDVLLQIRNTSRKKSANQYFCLSSKVSVFKKNSEAFYCQVKVTDLDHQYSCSPAFETMQWPASLSIVFEFTLG